MKRPQKTVVVACAAFFAACAVAFTAHVATADIYDAGLYSPVLLMNITETNRATYVADAKAAGVEAVWLCIADFYFDEEARRQALLEKLSVELRHFEEAGFSVGVWINGFGWGNERAFFKDSMKITTLEGKARNGAVCPLDPKLRRALIDDVRDIARVGAKFILMDDDYVQSSRRLVGCSCPRHLARIAAKCGRQTVTCEDVKAAFTGKPNALRTAYLDVGGEVLMELTRELRQAVDEVRPSVGMGLAASYTHWDVEGCDLPELLGVFAGKGRRVLRISGAPYWQSARGLPDTGLADVIEFVRMQSAWTRGLDMTVFDENDPYPRRVAKVPAWRCELYDKAVIADGRLARLKYMLHYGVDRTEPGYLEAHLADMSDDAKLRSIFAGTEPYGVKVDCPQHRLRTAELPSPFIGEAKIAALYSMPTAAFELRRKGIPTRFDGPAASDEPLAVTIRAPTPDVYQIVHCDRAKGEYAVLLENMGSAAADVKVVTKGQTRILTSLRGEFAVVPDGIALGSLPPHSYAAVRFVLEPQRPASRSPALDAETAQLRIMWGDVDKPFRIETRGVEMVPVGDSSFRVTVPKGVIPSDATCVDIVPQFMKARKGDDGWWMQARGTYGLFDKDEGCYSCPHQLMPVFAVKKGTCAWYAHVKTWRFNYDFVTTAKGGQYETFARFRCDGVHKCFKDYYDDIVMEFHRLDGADADYSGVARMYRNYQLDRGAVRTIRDRVKEYPELDYLCDAIVVRIQTHAAKPIPETEDGIEQKFFKAGEELPIVVHMPFGVAEEFMQALKDAGIDKLSICSAGWQNGGYDGRVPGHFPIGAEAGGADAFNRLIAKAKNLGYQFALHATNTDGYMCSRLWNEDWVCKFADGRLHEGYVWAGGQCYWVCQQCAWERWLPKEMREMAALGIRGPHYIDVYSATYPIPCGDPKHICTPEKTAEYQNRILAYGKELMGGAASESGYDHVAGNVDYINYIERDLKNLYEGKHDKLVSGVFPLWELVYHGIILYNSDRLTQNHTRGKCLYKLEKSGDPRWMEGDGVEDPYIALKIVEFGGRPIFYTYKFADVPRIKRAWDEFVPVRHLQRELMTSHREVAKDVFETCYSDGSRTVCNYRAEAFPFGGETVPSMGYVLFGPDGAPNNVASFK